MQRDGSAKRSRISHLASPRTINGIKRRFPAALAPEQVEILQKRGVLSPDEIHKLASKTKRKMGAEETKAACHSDAVDSEQAQQIQEASLGDAVGG